jgi:hypothetical protein
VKEPKTVSDQRHHDSHRAANSNNPAIDFSYFGDPKIIVGNAIRESQNRSNKAIDQWQQVARLHALEPIGLLRLKTGKEDGIIVTGSKHINP